MEPETSLLPPQALPAQSFPSLAALGKNAWWRFVLALLLVLVLWIGGTAIVIFTFPETAGAMTGELVGVPALEEAKIAFALLHLSFGAGALGLFLAIRFIHKRTAKSAITAAPKFRWMIFGGAALVAIAAGLAMTPFTDTRGLDALAERWARFSPADWALLVVVYATGTLIQGGWEEVLTRGWLLQQVSHLAKNPWVGVAVSTLVFVAMHIGHPGWATYVTAGLMGAAFGWSAVRLNGLEAAIGAHFANNFIAGLLTGAFLAGNPPALDVADMVGVVIYVALFVGFVEFCARRGAARVGV